MNKKLEAKQELSETELNEVSGGVLNISNNYVGNQHISVEANSALVGISLKDVDGNYWQCQEQSMALGGVAFGKVAQWIYGTSQLPAIKCRWDDLRREPKLELIAKYATTIARQ